MMKQSLQGTVAPRSQDELEGTLLLAVEVDDNTPSAAPTAHFQYADASVDLFEATADLPTAPMVPKFDNIKERERAEAQKLALGKLRGLQQAELEREQVQKADIRTYSTNYYASLKVTEANKVAIERDVKGVHIEKDTWFGNEKPEKKQETKTVEKKEPAFATSQDGGYEVTEYPMGEYETNDDYQFSEYKSVYDK